MLDAVKLQIRRKYEDDNLDMFTCGDEDLDEFFRFDAQHYYKAKLATTFILKYDSEIAAYFSLANDRLSYHDFGDLTLFNRFRKRHFVNSKRIKGYPAVKICRLGVNEAYKNKKVGTFIIDYIKGNFFNQGQSACRFLTVDANSDAVGFYQKNGFNFVKPLLHTDSPTTPLYFDLADLDRY
jgi:ribosomal protein S18 acetylase RimI-like enzyme